MITFRILDIFVLTVLGTGWTCCLLMILIKYQLFNKLEEAFDTKTLSRFLPFCYFCIGFWLCFILVMAFVSINHDSELAALLASLCAAPFIRILMLNFH